MLTQHTVAPCMYQATFGGNARRLLSAETNSTVAFTVQAKYTGSRMGSENVVEKLDKLVDAQCTVPGLCDNLQGATLRRSWTDPAAVQSGTLNLTVVSANESSLVVRAVYKEGGEKQVRSADGRLCMMQGAGCAPFSLGNSYSRSHSSLGVVLQTPQCCHASVWAARPQQGPSACKQYDLTQTSVLNPPPLALQVDMPIFVVLEDQRVRVPCVQSLDGPSVGSRLFTCAGPLESNISLSFTATAPNTIDPAKPVTTSVTYTCAYYVCVARMGCVAASVCALSALSCCGSTASC